MHHEHYYIALICNFFHAKTGCTVTYRLNKEEGV